jgi:hypothetical protein
MDAPDLTKSESSLDKLLGETLSTLLGETSWLLSHAQALSDYGRIEEADAELARAVSCEEQIAYLLDAVGREQEAVFHRVRAAVCYQRLGERARAVTLLRAALSARLADDYRRRVEQQVARCLAQAKTRIEAPPASERRTENKWKILLNKKGYSVWRSKPDLKLKKECFMPMIDCVDNETLVIDEIELSAEELEEVIAPLVCGMETQHNETLVIDEIELSAEELEDGIAPFVLSNHNETLSR